MGSEEDRTGNPCKACDQYGRCEKPCHRLESLLVQEDTGRSSREVHLGDGFDIADRPTGNSEDQYDAAQVDSAEDAKDLFWYGAERLTQNQLRAYLLRMRDDRTYADIGKALECSRQAAHTHFRKAVRRLTKRA